MLHLEVILPRNRNLQGRLRLVVDGRPKVELRVLGRGSRGDGTTWFLERGNTPTGDYGGDLEETSHRDRTAYGPWGAVRLRPAAGNGLLAYDVFGRNGLLIHGGSAGEWYGGELRPTLGCLRLSNADMRTLREAVEDERNDRHARVCREAEIRVTVRDG